MNYFKDREFACRDGTPYPNRWRRSRLKALRSVLNAIRREWGAPITVMSAFRTEAYNRKVGGARRSQHPQGRAGDLIPSGGSARRLHDLILDMYRDGKIPRLKGLGIYKPKPRRKAFVHVDVRPSRRLHRWKG